MDGQTLSKAMGGTLPIGRYNTLAAHFSQALREAGATTVNRAAMFCAQVAEESHGLAWMTELASGSEYEHRADLGNTHAGDGVRYKGRGPIQVTGRENYAAVSVWAHAHNYVPSGTYFVDHPEQLASDADGFLGAVWFWTTHGLNELADQGDVHGATLKINGGLNGLDQREANWTRCHALGDALLPTVQVPLRAGLIGIFTSQAPARTSPGGPLVTQHGKQVIHKKGDSFKIAKIAKAKNGDAYVSGGQYWYYAGRIACYSQGS